VKGGEKSMTEARMRFYPEGLDDKRYDTRETFFVRGRPDLPRFNPDNLTSGTGFGMCDYTTGTPAARTEVVEPSRINGKEVIRR
jgi:hypothetical protein